MRKRLLRMSFALAIGFAILVAGIWLLSQALGDRQMLYQGKSANYWGERANSPDATISNQANALLSNEIIPHLTRVMFCDTNDSGLRLSLAEKLNGLPGILIFCTPADGRRASAAAALGDLGSAAKAAVPALIQALNGHDGAVRGAAARALGKIHCEPEVVIPLLITCLDDKEINDEAAAGLGEFGSLSRAAVPRLIPLLKIPDKDLHAAVTVALKKIDPAAAAEAGVR